MDVLLINYLLHVAPLLLPLCSLALALLGGLLNATKVGEVTLLGGAMASAFYSAAR
jgi:hypothetical protein